MIYIHIFVFLNFWFWEKKGSQIFFVPLEYQKKLQIFKKHRKNTIQESFTKKGAILHHAPQITLFLLTL